MITNNSMIGENGVIELLDVFDMDNVSKPYGYHYIRAPELTTRNMEMLVKKINHLVQVVNLMSETQRKTLEIMGGNNG